MVMNVWFAKSNAVAPSHGQVSGAEIAVHVACVFFVEH
jgi:hypothetical protein